MKKVREASKILEKSQSDADNNPTWWDGKCLDEIEFCRWLLAKHHMVHVGHFFYDIDGYLYSLTMGTVENKEAFEQKINELLRDDWDFDRLSMLEQAILLISFQEILANDTPKAVVINEAITLAKKYCDDNSYKLLNGVLDQL